MLYTRAIHSADMIFLFYSHQLRAELESTETSISSQAKSHIDTNEVVLVCGGCALMEAFLRAAARATSLSLIVAEGHCRREVRVVLRTVVVAC